MRDEEISIGVGIFCFCRELELQRCADSVHRAMESLECEASIYLFQSQAEGSYGVPPYFTKEEYTATVEMCGYLEAAGVALEYVDLGPNKSIEYGIEWSHRYLLERHPVDLMLTDDVELSRGALCCLSWMAERFWDDARVAATSPYGRWGVHSLESEIPHSESLLMGHYFQGSLESRWAHKHQLYEKPWEWARTMPQHICHDQTVMEMYEEAGLVCVTPMITRTRLLCQRGRGTPAVVESRPHLQSYFLSTPDDAIEAYDVTVGDYELRTSVDEMVQNTEALPRIWREL